MAAAAYGAVVSLMHVLDNLQHPSRQQLHYDRDQIKTLGEKVSFLLGFLENYSQILCHTEPAEDLARQLADVVDEAEEIIDYHVVDQLNQQSAYEVDNGLSSFREDMDNVLNKIESIKKELMMVKDQEMVVKEPQQRVSQPNIVRLSTPASSIGINTMVGFDEHLVCIIDQLTGHDSDLQIVPITGMGGIGKTTLAQNVFVNNRIVNHFDLCKWITISQSYSIQDVVLGLLGELDNKNNNESKQILAELGGQLHKILFGKRYLIVMDDVWSEDIWDKLRWFFPNNKNGSRIVVTTRLSKVADSLGSENPFLIDFLDEEKSWKLFCIKAFGKEVWSNHEFEKIGKSIVKCCKGLPLAIVVIGGLLGKSNMTLEDWELVGKDVMQSLVNTKDDEDCSNILSLSYNHLPIHLKPCFLYFRVFREDDQIYVEDLVHYWIAEGFIKPKGGKTLEEIGHEYLMDLVDRNLVLIEILDHYTGQINNCKVHDLLRDLCIREYEKEHFFCISKVVISYVRLQRTCFLCCYREASTSINLPQVSTITTSPTLVNCFVCNVCNTMCSLRNRLRLVKVAVNRYRMEYVNTRLRYFQKISLKETSLTLLWNLQYLNCRQDNHEVPLGIWEMPQFRYLNCPDLYVDVPVTQNGTKDYVVLENLQILRSVANFRCTNEILKRIPNVRELVIEHMKFSEQMFPLNSPLRYLADLHKLESLHCTDVSLEILSFPNSLKYLYLFYCNCNWERMMTIGSLPNLEVLHLMRGSRGPEWNPIEGEFLRLKRLVIWDTALEYWNAEKEHFPKLEILELSEMKSLEKIPSGIGEIETLREIRLKSVTRSLVQSAEEIIEEQREYGNEDVQLVFK